MSRLRAATADFWSRLRRRTTPSSSTVVQSGTEIDNQIAKHDSGMRQIRALLVNEVDEMELCAAARRLDTAHLPHRMIDIPLSARDIEASAILSWRWDTDLEEPSRNLRAALRVARKVKKRYLFIDVVSILQQLPSEQLIRAVMAFSELYAQIMVIMCYEKYGTGLSLNIDRPWIVHERTVMLSSTRSVIVVHHDITFLGNFAKKCLKNMIDSISPHQKYPILHPSFGKIAFRLLTDTNLMADMADFRYLLPKYHISIADAFHELSCNEYLVTVAILAEEAEIDISTVPDTLLDLPLGMYTWDRAHGKGPNEARLYLGDVMVAYCFLGTLFWYPSAVATVLRWLGEPNWASTAAPTDPRNINYNMDFHGVAVDLKRPYHDEEAVLWHHEIPD